MSMITLMELETKISIVKDAVYETLWPTRCAICDRPGYLLCPSCSRKLPYIDQSKTCNICGEPFGRLQCCGCSGSAPFDKCTSVFFLNNDTGKIITTYKDAGERRLSSVIAYFITKAINPKWITPQTFITYIPSSKEAYLRRGFDHAELSALKIAENTNLKLVKAFNRPSSEDQRKLGRTQRMQNLSNKFSTTPDLELAFSQGYNQAILIDDVFTTGSTMASASVALKNFGISRVFCLNFSRTF